MWSSKVTYHRAKFKTSHSQSQSPRRRRPHSQPPGQTLIITQTCIIHESKQIMQLLHWPNRHKHLLRPVWLYIPPRRTLSQCQGCRWSSDFHGWNQVPLGMWRWLRLMQGQTFSWRSLLLMWYPRVAGQQNENWLDRVKSIQHFTHALLRHSKTDIFPFHAVKKTHVSAGKIVSVGNVYHFALLINLPRSWQNDWSLFPRHPSFFLLVCSSWLTNVKNEHRRRPERSRWPADRCKEWTQKKAWTVKVATPP